MIATPPRKLLRTLHALLDGGVDFIIVGGIAALLNGAPVSTLDLDVVHSRNPGNIARLLAVLEQLDALYRIQPERRLRYLASAGHQNLITSNGPLDVLGTIGNNLGYDELLPKSEETAIGELRVRVLNLETLIAIKEELGGEKDLATLPTLRNTLKERKKLGYTPQQ